MQLRAIFRNNLFVNFISLGAIQGINYLLPLITVPFLYNQLGVENYGLVNFSFAFLQYFMILTDFGFGLSGTRFISEHRDDPNQVNRFLNSACIARFLMACISFLFYIGCVFFVPKFSSHIIFSLLFFGMVLGNVLNPSWFFQGMEQMKFNTLLHVTTRLISILPLFILVKVPNDYIYIPIFYSSGSIIAGIISIVLIRNQFNMRFFFTTLREIWDVTIDSAKYFMSRISVSLYTNTNTVLLGLVCGNTAVGYYSLADKIYVALNSVYGPINGAIFPYMTKNRNLNLFKKIFVYGILLNGMFILCCHIIFPYIFPYVFKNNFSDISYSVLSILMISNLIDLPATFLGYPFLAAWGHADYCNYSLIFTSMFHILVLLALYALGFINVLNVAIVVVLSEIFLLSVRVLGVRHFKLWI